jgi:hypothetical protein
MHSAAIMKILMKVLRAFLFAVVFGVALAPVYGHTQLVADTAACPGMETGLWTIRATRKIPLLKSQTGPGAILLYSTVDGKADELNVNSDGSPRAYHLLDPQGTAYALNDMTSGGVQVWENGVEIKYDDDSLSPDEQKKQNAHYYQVFARMVRENNNFGISPSTYKPRSDTVYKLGDDFGNNLDPPSRPAGALAKKYPYLGGWKAPAIALEPVAPPIEPAAGFRCLSCQDANSCRVCFQDNIVKFDGDKICVRKTGRYTGFLVNQTGLDSDAGNSADPGNDEDSSCDAPVNLDPEKLPGLVLPHGQFAPDGNPALTAQKGDIVIGFNPGTQKWAFGIVSDGGPPGKFGEASIAFNRILQLGYKDGSKYPRPLMYYPTLENSPYQLPRPVGFLILPGTKEKFKKWTRPNHMHEYDFSPQTVASTAKAAFLDWAGTGDMNSARDRFRRCLALLPPK